MARPIDLILTLEGQDAQDFEEYLKNPTFPDTALSLMSEVIADRKKRGLF